MQKKTTDVSGASTYDAEVYYYVHKYFDDALYRHKISVDDKKYEVDVFIPSINVAIEYDGGYYHRNRQLADEKKNEALNNADIFVFRIRGRNLPKLQNFIGEVIIHDKDNISTECIEKLFHTLSYFVPEKN